MQIVGCDQESEKHVDVVDVVGVVDVVDVVDVRTVGRRQRSRNYY